MTFVVIASIFLILIFTVPVVAVTLQDFWYETFSLKVFIEQIKACFNDDTIYNIPFPISHFKNMTIFGKIIFVCAWILFAPSYILGWICSFILWGLYWIMLKLCYKDNLED